MHTTFGMVAGAAAGAAAAGGAAVSGATEIGSATAWVGTGGATIDFDVVGRADTDVGLTAGVTAGGLASAVPASSSDEHPNTARPTTANVTTIRFIRVV